MCSVARITLVWKMVFLLVLAGCSSTPRVVEAGPQPETTSTAYRALIEAHHSFQTVAALAAKEDKKLDWAKATQSTDPDGRQVVQIPLWWNDDNLELIVVMIEQERVSDVLLSRISLERGEQSAQIAFTDLSTKMVTTASVKMVEGKPVLQKEVWGVAKGTSSISQMLQPISPEISKQCNWQHPEVVLAIAGLAFATQAMYAACFWGWWTPACWGAIAAYGVALVAYYATLRAHGCIH